MSNLIKVNGLYGCLFDSPRYYKVAPNQDIKNGDLVVIQEQALPFDDYFWDHLLGTDQIVKVLDYKTKD